MTNTGSLKVMEWIILKKSLKWVIVNQADFIY